MSVKKSLSLNGSKASSAVGRREKTAKRGRFDRCFSFDEISIEPGKKLKKMDSKKLKDEIKRWAKAVGVYARLVSGRFGNSSQCKNL
ncbi:hypothetical protein L6164_021469 [Bauhinia variegata]|uniref:Uncharacterized protein n=1 Tax=Bauhinia variegata TaxID=167791 RepID=A0ACB9N000_BAUVA|nr:hypothetical protein L6164_021469 [Bauhinia variegata]